MINMISDWLRRKSVWLLDHLPDAMKESKILKGNAETAADQLYPGIRKDIFCRKHQIKKLMILLGGILILAVLLLVYGALSQGEEVVEYAITRADADGSSREYILEAEIEGMEDSQNLAVTVRPRKYTEAEIEQLMKEVYQYIDLVLPGENESLECVEQALCFPESFPGENVSIEWQPHDYNLIRSDGTLGDLTLYELPVETTVTAVISYEGETVYYEKPLIITGRQKTEEESLLEDLYAAVEKLDEQSAESSQLQLPTSVDGYAVKWKYYRDNMLPELAAVGLCLIVCMVFYEEEKLKKRMQARTEQLLYDYPSFVHRMVLMLGAGMTVRRSWEQLISDYEQEKAGNREDAWLYHEMKYAQLQMQAGIPETQVYMNFGRRTELPQYMKFSQLLLQRIRRGSSGMQEMMMQEAYEAEKERRDLARRKGETAGTKLLLPMMLLLIIVLLIVMVPAFITM